MTDTGKSALRDSVAIVTGASRGIGRATALALGARGASVVCAARTLDAGTSAMPGTLREAVDEIRAAGGTALAVACDVTDESQVAALAEQTLGEFGHIDVLVNNAAVNVLAPFAETTLKRWDLVLNVNLRGTVACTSAVLPAMIERGAGRIINISSGAVSDPALAARLGIIPYAVSKAAVEMLTRTLAEELAPHGVGVNCLRIESAVATEGALLMNPETDTSGWEQPATAADAVVRLAVRDVSNTGNVVTIAEVRSGG